MRVFWPLPALFAWAMCWAAFIGLQALAAPVVLAFTLPTLLGAAFATAGTTPWRRVFIATGFPLSLAASGLAGGLPPWAWLAPLIALALLYPMNAWRDAPVFPTRRGTLRGLARLLSLGDGARVLDAGSGLGDALLELRREYPRARLTGIEWSWPLRIAAALRCPFATLQRADMWLADWSQFDLVYLFQRPESMERAATKAASELRPGAWLASLEFEIPTLKATQIFDCADDRPLWLYRAPFVAVETITPRANPRLSSAA